MGDLYADLEWLLKAPPDFRKRCRALLESESVDGNAIARLAGFALDENQLQQLASVITDLRKRGAPLSPLSPFKLGVLGNATLDGLIPALVASAARHGVLLECVKADFGQTIQEALSPDSTVNRAKPDAVLIALDYHGLPFTIGNYNDADAAVNVSAALEFVSTLRAGFLKYANAPSIVQTVPPPPEAIFGSFDRAVAGTARSLCGAFNAGLTESLRDTQDLLFDVDALAQTVGLANWHAPMQWNMAKFAFDASYLPLYADHVGRILGALRGKSRKCLILDLDNTLWGGVIGDDGLEGIVIGQGNPTGEAYLDVQRTAVALRDRGIVLAVSSKNTDEVARAVFLKHPEMLLRENHIAVFQANWNDKATNISAIASELALGIDSMVFLDDNPIERGLVREMLPQVGVPELPDDPALYARTLLAAGYFESIAFSDEDRKRADFYQDNARRVALQGQVGDLDAYLASLKMEIVFRPFDATGRSRISQLVNKSNQFNLTTHRYTEAEIGAFEVDPGLFTMQVRLADAFGDNGMICVVVCRARSAEEWEIDTWLMSCRVLGRRVEQMVLREILHHARARGIKRLVGVYIPTEKNGMVAEHYGKLGFRLIGESPDGHTTWELDTEFVVDEAPMVVDRSGYDLSTTH